MQPDFLKHNYSQFYAALTDNEVSLDEFMNFINSVYDIGNKIGKLQGQSEAIQRINDYLSELENANRRN